MFSMWKLRNILLIFLVALISITSCVSKSGDVTKPTTPPPTVPPAPKQLYIKVGQFEQFTYEGHDIAVNYTSAYPVQIVKVTVDGVERKLQKELTESPGGVYWNEGTLGFALKPVFWETREGQRIPIYEKTWNTTELYFEVFSSGGK